MQLKLEREMTNPQYVEELSTSSINFWSDMVEIAKTVDHSKDKEFKLEWIREKLRKMNKHLPSFVFLPSGKAKIRCKTLMHVEIGETKIYQTKTKTNFALCFQLVKPEEYLMRHNYVLRDKIEKKIKTKCKKIMELEMKGANWKKEEQDRRSIQNKFKNNLISHRDRNSYNPKTDKYRNSRGSGEKQRRRINSMYVDTENPFLMNLGGKKEPLLLEGGGKFEGNFKNLRIDDMNVSQILNYTAVRKMSCDDSFFSTMMMKKEKEDPTAGLKDDKEGDGEEAML